MLNKYIKSMVEKGMIIGGKISTIDGFVMFQRVPLEELEQLDETEIAFATQSMGRAIFQIDSNNKIRNIKGVDSHLDNKENALVQLSGSATMPITTDGKDYLESTHPINLMVQPGKKLDIRIRGTSPLEDIEIEADINAKMQHLGIKLPQIESVREYPYELSEQLGLPTKIIGSYDEFTSDYRKENNQRKKNLHTIYGERYEEDLPDGLRPEKTSEYFRRIGVIDSEEFKLFAEGNHFTVNDFIECVDKSYSMGQRYGQAVRIMESPFRISDLEYYVENNDIIAIQDIVEFTQEMQETEVAFENIFAKQMGTNIALMMNKGWMCENFVHRQDYSLVGEMCDDSYFSLIEKMKSADKRIQQNNKEMEEIRRNNPDITDDKILETREQVDKIKFEKSRLEKQIAELNENIENGTLTLTDEEKRINFFKEEIKKKDDELEKFQKTKKPIIDYINLETDNAKTEAGIKDKKSHFFSQIYFISSNIKVLQDEMQLRGKQPEEIESVMNDFVESFAQNIDFKEMANTFGKKEQDIRDVFSKLIGVPRDYTKTMAGESRAGGMIYDKAILRAHQGNNEFYNNLSAKLAIRLDIDRSMVAESNDFLSSAIEATEETTRTGIIDEQVNDIRNIQKGKIQQKNKNYNGIDK